MPSANKLPMGLGACRLNGFPAFNQVKAGNPFSLQAPNPNFIGNLLAEGIGTNGAAALFGPAYKSPRSLQLNIGIQREIRHGMVFSADYLRNVETRTPAGIDVNRAGDVSTFNLAGANAAVAATNASFGCASVDCAIGAGATMANYADNGLGSSTDIGAGCTSVLGIGRPCAFGGVNPDQSQMYFLKPVGPLGL